MEELKQLATWVKQQHAEEYILTWLLTQPGLWWSDGEVYEAALAKSSDRLKSYVQKNERSEILRGIATSLAEDESWEAVAVSLTKIFAVYQEELAKLQEYRRNMEIVPKPTSNDHGLSQTPPPPKTSPPKIPVKGDPLTGQF